MGYRAERSGNLGRFGARYESIHAFSRQFKRLMGVTPLGYLRTIKE